MTEPKHVAKPETGGRFVRKSRDEKLRRTEDATAPAPARTERPAPAAAPATPAEPAAKKGK